MTDCPHSGYSVKEQANNQEPGGLAISDGGLATLWSLSR